MIGRLRRGWAWFVDGLTDALLWAVDRTARVRRIRVEVSENEAALLGPDGARIGRLTGGQQASRFEPPELARSLAGASFDIVVPTPWLFRRDLDAVAIQSRPFLDAFVRHQIERITPWRAADAHYRILTSPVPGDAGRLAVAVAVVPKRILARWLAPVEALHPQAICLKAAAGPGGQELVMPLGDNRLQRLARLRRVVLGALVTVAVATGGLIGWLQWQVSVVQSDLDDQDQVLAQRKAVLARAAKHDRAGGDEEARLRHLRDGRISAVAVIDALAAAVPDTAHLTTLAIDKDHVTITGVSTDPSGLVPALETSGRFADVTASAATTRVETGRGDRFSLDMKALAPKPASAEPLAAASVTSALPALAVPPATALQ